MDRCFAAEKPLSVHSEVTAVDLAGSMKGCVSLITPAGGECVGVNFTVPNVGSKVLAMSRASKLLNVSDHF